MRRHEFRAQCKASKTNTRHKIACTEFSELGNLELEAGEMKSRSQRGAIDASEMIDGKSGRCDRSERGVPFGGTSGTLIRTCHKPNPTQIQKPKLP
jgi:hypothetical protein